MDRVTFISPLLLKYMQNSTCRFISGKSRIRRKRSRRKMPPNLTAIVVKNKGKLGKPFLQDMQKSGPRRLPPRWSWTGKNGWIVKDTQKSTKRPHDVKADRLFTIGPKRVSSASAHKSPAHRWRTYGIYTATPSAGLMASTMNGTYARNLTHQGVLRWTMILLQAMISMVTRMMC